MLQSYMCTIGYAESVLVQYHVIFNCLLVSREIWKVFRHKEAYVSLYCWLNCMEIERLFISYTTGIISAQTPHNKIIFLCNRHRLRAPLICSRTIKQSSCNTSIQFVPDLEILWPYSSHLQIRYNLREYIIAIIYNHIQERFKGKSIANFTIY